MTQALYGHMNNKTIKIKQQQQQQKQITTNAGKDRWEKNPHTLFVEM
jgi:hypothetical protein